MYVYVCFDVEDLVHPDSDNVALDIANTLAAEGVVASMCIVGEKARLWERRGRKDVIRAMAPHDVLLHTDRHSMHPTPSEYLADKGWADGVAEAVRREGPGARDLARIFGRPPSSWGTPGSSWGPQVPAATRQLGIPSNIYSHARSGNSGACWYAGQLCFSEYWGFPGGEDAYADDAVFEAALPGFLERVAQAQRSGLSCLGLFAAHPTRLLFTVFWDKLNYAHGQSTDPSQYRFAPRRSGEDYARALRNLRRMVLAVRDLPGIEIISVRDLVGRFAPGEGTIKSTELQQLARTIVESGTIPADNPLASPAQALDAMARALLGMVAFGAPPAEVPLRTVLGPVEQPPVLEKPVSLIAENGVGRLNDLVRQIDATGHLPSAIAMGSGVGPGPLLRLLAQAFVDLTTGEEPGRVTLTPGAEEPAPAAQLAEEGIYKSLPGWVAHPPDLRLDQLALHTRLQSWSLRPAVLRST